MFEVLNDHATVEWSGMRWVLARGRAEADWDLRLETQRYIDRGSDLMGHSATFRMVTPKITMLSLDHWGAIPSPRSAFGNDLFVARRHMLLLELARAFRIPSAAFREAVNSTSHNNIFLNGSTEGWLNEDDKTFNDPLSRVHVNGRMTSHGRRVLNIM